MNIIEVGNDNIVVADIQDFSLEQTFESGQCFRWHKVGNGIYDGIAYGKPLAAEQLSRDTIKFYTTVEEFKSFWSIYFDMHTNYSEIKSRVQYDKFLKQATEYGWGIRILKQEPWEALCSFIISQRNSIPRIKNTVERLSTQYGTQVNYRGKAYYRFPTPKNILNKAGYTGLVESGLGYRAGYVIQAAEAVDSGRINLNSLKSIGRDNAERQLLLLNGVGPKVANCTLLYGLGYINSFPIDVWIQRVIDEVYNGSMGITPFEDVAGIVQQYMFYYMRTK